MTNPEPHPPQKSTLGLARVLRAVAIGVGIFALLTYLPQLLWMYEGMPGPQASVPVEEEPIYRDQDGQPINEADHHLRVGQEQAKIQGITSHAACKTVFKGLQVMGCQRHVTEQKNIPPLVRQGDWSSGKTTAQCRAEVNAHWAAMTQNERELGNPHAAAVWTRRHWTPELRQCQNYDNVRIGKVIHEPTRRLDDLLLKQSQGGRVTDQDRAMVQRDMQLVSTYPDDPAKRAYLDKVDQFFVRADRP